jgi:hypothetical protein
VKGGGGSIVESIFIVRDLVSYLIKRFQKSQMPGWAWVSSSLYKCGHLRNLEVMTHVVEDTMECPPWKSS